MSTYLALLPRSMTEPSTLATLGNDFAESFYGDKFFTIVYNLKSLRKQSRYYSKSLTLSRIHIILMHVSLQI